jgi:hypothetical protein
MLLSNLLFMRTWFRHHYDQNEEIESRFVKSFRAGYTRNVPLAALIENTAKALRLSDPLAKDVFRYCAWTDRIPVSLKHTLSLNTPLVLRRLNIHA